MAHRLEGRAHGQHQMGDERATAHRAQQTRTVAAAAAAAAPSYGGPSLLRLWLPCESRCQLTTSSRSSLRAGSQQPQLSTRLLRRCRLPDCHVAVPTCLGAMRPWGMTGGSRGGRPLPRATILCIQAATASTDSLHPSSHSRSDSCARAHGMRCAPHAQEGASGVPGVRTDPQRRVLNAISLLSAAGPCTAAGGQAGSKALHPASVASHSAKCWASQPGAASGGGSTASVSQQRGCGAPRVWRGEHHSGSPAHQRAQSRRPRRLSLRVHSPAFQRKPPQRRAAALPAAAERRSPRRPPPPPLQLPPARPHLRAREKGAGQALMGRGEGAAAEAAHLEGSSNCTPGST